MSRAFRRHEGIAAALPMRDINTDVVYPQRFLRRTDIPAMGQFLFHGLALDEQGRRDPSFVLNRPPFDAATILVAGRNFGCGSSREHAAWALAGVGIRCVVSSLFADIFRANCINNGILPATLGEEDLARCLAAAGDPATCRFAVDLETRTIAHETLGTMAFVIDEAERRRLLEGADSIDETLTFLPAIEAHEAERHAREPWLAVRTERLDP